MQHSGTECEQSGGEHGDETLPCTPVTNPPLLFPQDAFAAMIGHMYDGYPLEACGLLVGRGSRVDYVLLYAYLDQEPRPVMVQEAKYLPPFGSGKKPYLLTGEQHLYAGPVERELVYRCWLSGVAR